MEKRTLIFDVDDVIVPDHFLPIVNRYLEKQKRPTYESLECFKTFAYVKNEIFKNCEGEIEKFIEYYQQFNPYIGMEPIEGAVDSLARLCETDDVFLATSCLPYYNYRLNPRQYGDKMLWLVEHLPFISPSQIIAISQKHVLTGYSMTDDNIGNLNGQFEKKILFEAWHNKEIPDEELAAKKVVRAKNWNQLMNHLEQ